jgi:flagellar biosynthesis/type III secretory pathway chaperone
MNTTSELMPLLLEFKAVLFAERDLLQGLSPKTTDDATTLLQIVDQKTALIRQIQTLASHATSQTPSVEAQDNAITELITAIQQLNHENGILIQLANERTNDSLFALKKAAGIQQTYAATGLNTHTTFSSSTHEVA